jgi:DNA-directed RNA polymerase specialized sigma24 family protein
MTLEEAIAVIAGGGEGRQEAWVVVDAEVDRMARVAALELRDEVAQGAKLRFFELQRAGRLGGVENLGAYLYSIVRNIHRDLHRGAQRRKETSDEVLVTHHSDGEAPDELLEERELQAEATRALALLRRVGEAACVASPRAAPKLRQSLEELLRLAAHETTVRELVGDPEDDLAFRKRRDALLKRHERTRDRLLQTAKQMVLVGELSPADGALLVRVVRGYLVRRRTSEE